MLLGERGIHERGGERGALLLKRRYSTAIGSSNVKMVVFLCFGHLVGRAPNWSIAPTGCGVQTTCPRLLLESAVVRDRTPTSLSVGPTR